MLAQAWEAFCRRKQECGRHPQPPTKAYLISLPEDAPKREHSQRLLAELGFDVEIIDGIKSVQVCCAHCQPHSIPWNRVKHVTKYGGTLRWIPKPYN